MPSPLSRGSVLVFSHCSNSHSSNLRTWRNILGGVPADRSIHSICSPLPLRKTVNLYIFLEEAYELEHSFRLTLCPSLVSIFDVVARDRGADKASSPALLLRHKHVPGILDWATVGVFDLRLKLFLRRFPRYYVTTSSFVDPNPSLRLFRVVCKQPFPSILQDRAVFIYEQSGVAVKAQNINGTAHV